MAKAKEYVAKHMSAGYSSSGSASSSAKNSGKTDAYTLAVVANFAADYGKDRDFAAQALQLLLDARTDPGVQRTAGKRGRA